MKSDSVMLLGSSAVVICICDGNILTGVTSFEKGFRNSLGENTVAKKKITSKQVTEVQADAAKIRTATVDQFNDKDCG